MDVAFVLELNLNEYCECFNRIKMVQVTNREFQTWLSLLLRNLFHSSCDLSPVVIYLLSTFHLTNAVWKVSLSLVLTHHVKSNEKRINILNNIATDKDIDFGDFNACMYGEVKGTHKENEIDAWSYCSAWNMHSAASKFGLRRQFIDQDNAIQHNTFAVNSLRSSVPVSHKCRFLQQIHNLVYSDFV